VFGKHSSSCQSELRLDTVRSTDLNFRRFLFLALPVSQLNPKNQGSAQGRHHRIVRLGPLLTSWYFFRLLHKNGRLRLMILFSPTFFHPSDNGRQKPESDENYWSVRTSANNRSTLWRIANSYRDEKSIMRHFIFSEIEPIAPGARLEYSLFIRSLEVSNQRCPNSNRETENSKLCWKCDCEWPILPTLPIEFSFIVKLLEFAVHLTMLWIHPQRAK